MLTIGSTPLLFKMLRNANIEEFINQIEIASNCESTNEAGMKFVGALLKVLTTVEGSDLTEFVAKYKDISLEEAEKVDVFEFVNEIKNDEKIKEALKTLFR